MDDFADKLTVLTGRQVNDDLVEAVRSLVVAAVKSYTRGRGFDDHGNPAEDIETVLTTATLRYLVNPQGLQQEAMGPLSVRHGATDFLAFTLTEVNILNRFRLRAK